MKREMDGHDLVLEVGSSGEKGRRELHRSRPLDLEHAETVGSVEQIKP